MKKIFLAIFLLITISSFAQKKDTTIILPKPVAKEVVKDIIKGDSATAELLLVKSNYKLLEQNIALKDTIIASDSIIISLHKEKAKNYESIIRLKDSQIKQYDLLANKLNKDLKREKRKKTFLSITGTAIIRALAYLLITK